MNMTLQRRYGHFGWFFFYYPAVPSGSPENFMGVAQSSDTIVLTWDPPLQQNRNGIITDYIINVTALDTGEISQYITPDRSLTLNSLTPFSTYAFIIAARTSVGAGPFSTDIIIRTLEDGKRIGKSSQKISECSAWWGGGVVGWALDKHCLIKHE